MVAVGVYLTTRGNSKPAAAPASTNTPGLAATAPPSTNSLDVLDVNKAVMVTVELDFGAQVPSIAEALLSIERRHRPDDGTGRTFAILDAYGEPTPDGKKLHMSMHVSTEKPGVGSLHFTRTGAELWKARIVASTNAPPFSGKNLLILIDNGAGKTFTVDGSKGPSSILDAGVKELGVSVADFWPDGAEREFTFIYSACGCPVKAMVRREGDRTARSKPLPVMFPDDPAALQTISMLMKW
jgi:hypothetical protein